jgi:hypothetical protein
MTIKKINPHLAIDTEFFHNAFVNSCTGAPLLRIWPLSALWPITVRDGTESLQGLTRWDGRIFLNKLRETSINIDLLNEPNFGMIHLAGQYL